MINLLLKSTVTATKRTPTILGRAIERYRHAIFIALRDILRTKDAQK